MESAGNSLAAARAAAIPANPHIHTGTVGEGSASEFLRWLATMYTHIAIAVAVAAGRWLLREIAKGNSMVPKQQPIAAIRFDQSPRPTRSMQPIVA